MIKIGDWYLYTVYLLHIIAIAFPLIYIGSKKNDTEPNYYLYLKTIGIVALIYHSLALIISFYFGNWSWGWNILFGK